LLIQPELIEKLPNFWSKLMGSKKVMLRNYLWLLKMN